MLVDHPHGNYSFLRGIAPYSGGVVAQSGHATHHARFRRPLPLAAGFSRLRSHLDSVGRPVHALCGIELRSPAPFTFPGFTAFNDGYIGILRSWDLFLGDVNPLARTNVAPAVDAPAEPSMYGFSYTMPSEGAAPSFVVAGAGELPEGSLDPGDVVRLGDTSPGGLAAKIRFVMGLMSGRIAGLGVSWDLATVTEVYTVHAICPHIEREIAGATGLGAAHGITWHYSRPPIETIEYEMDVRGVSTELVLD